jgi:hypothetical protein
VGTTFILPIPSGSLGQWSIKHHRIASLSRKSLLPEAETPTRHRMAPPTRTERMMAEAAARRRLAAILAADVVGTAG